MTAIEREATRVVHQSLRLLLDHLDKQMETSPSRILADLTNEIQDLYDKTD